MHCAEIELDSKWGLDFMPSKGVCFLSSGKLGCLDIAGSRGRFLSKGVIWPVVFFFFFFWLKITSGNPQVSLEFTHLKAGINCTNLGAVF